MTYNPDEALSATVSKMEMSQSAIRLSTTSMAGRTNSTALRSSASGDVAFGQVGAEHEGDLRLDPGLEQVAEGDRLGVAVGHVGEQHAEVRGVHLHLLLHGG